MDQVAELIDHSDGTPLALCGHSYGEVVIAGVADRLGARLDHLVFIDAYVPAGPGTATGRRETMTRMPGRRAKGMLGRPGSGPANRQGRNGVR